jgi:hypothetical protein
MHARWVIEYTEKLSSSNGVNSSTNASGVIMLAVRIALPMLVVRIALVVMLALLAVGMVVVAM